MRFLRKLDIRKIIMFMIGLLISGGIVYATHTGFAADSEETSYDNSNTDLAATDVQAALDELYFYCLASLGASWDFSYSGSVKSLTVPYTGTYRLEVWGAQGGDSTYGGKGGYSSGNISLNKNDVLYVVVGGQGKCASGTSAGGYNGGGNSSSSGGDTRYRCSGGGATHIATSSGTLSSLSTDKGSVLIVAGGGGGSYYYSNAYYGTGGSGGGYIAGAGYTYRNGETFYSEKATQTSGYDFGLGQDGSTYLAGAGAGWYGGYYKQNAAGGGSGYINNDKLLSKGTEYKIMYGYGVDENDGNDIYTVSTTSYSSLPESGKAKAGDGHARITKLTIEES